MSTFAKIKWIASILLVFFIVLVTNLVDRSNFNRLSNSVTTMYEDRIVASDLLFQLSRIIQAKEVALLCPDSSLAIKQKEQTQAPIQPLIEAYSQTKLTENEQLLFDALQEELTLLAKQEEEEQANNTKTLLGSIEKIEQQLYELSKIQRQEAKRQVLISDKVITSINFFTQGEIIALIVMAILIQIIILYKPKSV